LANPPLDPAHPDYERPNSKLWLYVLPRSRPSRSRRRYDVKRWAYKMEKLIQRCKNMLPKK